MMGFFDFAFVVFVEKSSFLLLPLEEKPKYSLYYVQRILVPCPPFLRNCDQPTRVAVFHQRGVALAAGAERGETHQDFGTV